MQISRHWKNRIDVAVCVWVLWNNMQVSVFYCLLRILDVAFLFKNNWLFFVLDWDVWFKWNSAKETYLRWHLASIEVAGANLICFQNSAKFVLPPSSLSLPTLYFLSGGNFEAWLVVITFFLWQQLHANIYCDYSNERYLIITFLNFDFMDEILKLCDHSSEG